MKSSNITEDNSNSSNIWHCEPKQKNVLSRGLFFGDSPLNYLMPVLLLQISLTSVLSTVIRILLSPLGQDSFIPHMLAGMLLGPSILGELEPMQIIFFPPKSNYVSGTLALFGCMLFMFLVAVKMDLTTVLRTGKKTWAIGLLAFALPLAVSTIFAFILRTMITMDQKLNNSLFYIAFFLSSSSFHVIACQLADLKLLNSELGRLAVTSSMISGMISWVWVITLFTVRQNDITSYHQPVVWMLLCLLALVAIIIFILRPIMLWMIRRTPEGKPIKQSYIHVVFLMVLGCALCGEVMGQHFLVGPIVLGLAVPDGPPLGTALVEKLDPLVSTIMLPLYFLYSGAKVKFSMIQVSAFVVVELLALCSFLGKLIGSMLPSLYCNMPLEDAFSLGLIMSAKGITDIIYIQTAKHVFLIDEESYSIMVITTVLFTGAATPVVKFLYDPSKQYLSSLNKKRTIEHAPPNDELRIMACIHSEHSAPAIIHLLEMSNPTLQNPICFYLLHLIQLTARSSPLLIDHRRPWKKSPMHSSHSQHVINAFRLYEHHMAGKVSINPFTSISPYETMHDDVCMLAAVKRTSLLIMPFHQQWTLNGVVESSSSVRAVNRHVLRTAPCSVGILVERGRLSGKNLSGNVTFYSVGMIFVEGADDREALAYTMRMADHSNVSVTVIRLVEPRRNNYKSRILKSRGDHDGDMIHKFKIEYLQIKRHDYREEMVVDSVGMVNVIRSLEGCFDLILVGRQHSSDSPLFMGTSSELNEYPELGFLGDMLVSSDSKFESSVLVVQQQRLGGDNDLPLLCPMKCLSGEPFAIVEVPRDMFKL